MKNILLIGSSSASCDKLYNNYSDTYNFIRMSRNVDYSDIKDFDVLDTNTYINTNENIDGLVYFPGTINLKQFQRIELSDFQNDFNINVLGLINILKHYQNKFNAGSSVVLFSTVASKLGMPFHSSIAVSKSAIVGLMQSLAAEWSPKIRVNCISPSIFKSNMSQRMLSNEKALERISNNHPLRRVGSSGDISSLINFLLSDESSWITGQNISVDGGMSKIKL